MRETWRCQMSVPARSLPVATRIVAAMSRRVGECLGRVPVVWKPRRGGKANGSGLRPARWQAQRAHHPPPSDSGRSTFALAGTLAALRPAAAASLVVFATAGAPAAAGELTTIRVNTFPNAKALPVHV